MNDAQLPLIISIISILADIVVIVSFLEIITSTRSLKLEAYKTVNERMRNLPTKKLFSELPCEILLTESPICKKPPKRHRAFKGEDLSFATLKENKPQIAAAVEGLTDEQKKLAKECINGLNDITALIEAKIVNYEDFLSLHHSQVLRIIHILEPVRRYFESDQQTTIGGNYGQRLLRLYHQAYHYNMMHPKHRDKDIYIMIQGKRIEQPIIKGMEKERQCKKIWISFTSRMRFWQYKHFY